MNPFPFLSLGAPLLAAGLALAAFPLIAHLLHRRPQVYLVFPTIRLLSAALANQSRFSWLRRWLLLLLRCLLVTLIVAAFTRPLWQTANAAGGGKGVAVVIVIDASASSQQQVGGVQLWTSLVASAERTLGSLQPGLDVANVVEASGRPRVLSPRLTQNPATLIAELHQLRPTLERADLLRALALAGEQLARHGGPKKLIILSDLQQSNWSVLAEAVPTDLVPAGTEVTVVDPQQPVPDNVSLSAPRTFPPRPLVGQSTQLVVRVRNSSSKEKQARLGAVVNDRELPEQTVALQGGEQIDVPFVATFDAPGEQTVEFYSLGEDGLRPDDRVAQVVPVAERLPVTIVSDDLPRDVGSGTYFLYRALAPTGQESDRFDVRQVFSRDLETATLPAGGLVFVGYLGDLESAGAKKLAEFMQTGGTVLFFCGEGAVARHLETLDAAMPAGCLPWKPGPVRKLSAIDASLLITGGKWQTRLLREFDEQSQLALAQVLFHQVQGIVEIHPQAEVLLTYSDESPALASRVVGTGQLLVANFSPSLVSSDLGKHGVFVALMQILAQELQPSQSTGPTPLVGEPFQFPPQTLTKPAGLVEVRPPDGSRQSVPLPVPNAPLSAAVDRPTIPGVYRLEVDGRTITAATIQLDPRESDLTRMSAEDVVARLKSQGGAVQVVGDWTPLADLHGRQLWPWCLAAAMLLVAAELLCLGLWKR